MKKILLISVFLFVGLAIANAKQTFVPRYSSFIQIDEQGDTIDQRSSRTTLYKDDADGMFRVAVIHETLTLERIKYIKHMQTAASLSTLSAVLSGVSAFSSDWQQRYQGELLMYMNSTLAEIYNQNVNAAKKLEIETWVENTGTEELLLADQERGMMWFLQPGQVIRFTMQNPDVMQLRVSTVDHRKRHFVTIGAGSIMREANVAYEDDKCYVFPFYENEDGYQVVNHYILMDKITADQRSLSKDEFKAMKKSK